MRSMPERLRGFTTRRYINPLYTIDPVVGRFHHLTIFCSARSYFSVLSVSARKKTPAIHRLHPRNETLESLLLAASQTGSKVIDYNAQNAGRRGPSAS